MLLAQFRAQNPLKWEQSKRIMCKHIHNKRSSACNDGLCQLQLKIECVIHHTVLLNATDSLSKNSTTPRRTDTIVR